MENKHTPGPWIAAKPSSKVGLPIVSQSGRSIANVAYFNLGKQFANHDAESEANARLIAVAPELLEALGDIANARPLWGGGVRKPSKYELEIWEFVKELQDTARAAIAKAGGQG